MALSTIKRILRAGHVTVLGSAPLSQYELDCIASADRLICVNGSISSVNRIPDIWVLNSHHYDGPLWKDPNRWPDERRHLHDKMMQQSSGRSARHICFLLKDNSPDQTIARLQANNVTWRAHTALNPGQKMNIAVRAGVRKFATALNTSAGLFGLCLALACKSRSVTLCGFSYTNDYAYLTTVPPDTRKHITQDQEAISDLTARCGHKFSILTADTANVATV